MIENLEYWEQQECVALRALEYARDQIAKIIGVAFCSKQLELDLDYDHLLDVQPEEVLYA